MNIFETVFLGIVQGLTEFLPVSSSGHLVIFQNLFGITENVITMDVFFHAGTLLSVLVIFNKDIIKLIRGALGLFAFRKEASGTYGKLALLVIAANIPAGIAGVFFKDYIESFFAGGPAVFIFLIATGVVLYVSRFLRKEAVDIEGVTLKTALVIGIAQMMAILPGVSRSGITIVAGLLMSLKSEDSAKFSFLIMLPAVAGATLLEVMDMGGKTSLDLLSAGTGVIVSFVTGYAALKLLLRLVKSYKLHFFSYYCVAAGLAGLVIL